VAQAHKLDCEAAAADCRFIVQSEDEAEAIELAKRHMRDVHGQDYTAEELRSEHLKIV
jgi:predicted small metal-binding protein